MKHKTLSHQTLNIEHSVGFRLLQCDAATASVQAPQQGVAKIVQAACLMLGGKCWSPAEITSTHQCIDKSSE